MYGVEQEVFAVHRPGALVGGKNRSTHPFEITNLVARNARMNVCGLRRESRPHFTARDRLREIIRRSRTQRLTHARKMFAVELIKVAIVGGVVLRPIPPVPVAALRNQDFFEGELALRLGGSSRILRMKLARVIQIIPCAVVLGSADPDVEIPADPP